MAKTIQEGKKQDYVDTLFRYTKGRVERSDENLVGFKQIWSEATNELTENDFSYEQTNRMGETFLLSSVNDRNYPIAKHLVAAKADVKALNKKNENILHLAAKAKANDFLSFLIEEDKLTPETNDPDRICIHDKDKFGYTALNLAQTVHADDFETLLTKNFPDAAIEKNVPEEDFSGEIIGKAIVLDEETLAKLKVMVDETNSKYPDLANQYNAEQNLHTFDGTSVDSTIEAWKLAGQGSDFEYNTDSPN